METPSFLKRKGRLESFIDKISKNVRYEDQFNSCVILHLKTKLKEDRNSAVCYMKECFDELLDNKEFLKWLSKKLDYQLCRLEKLLDSNQPERKSYHRVPHQRIYDFWLKNSTTSNDSANSSKSMRKLDYLALYDDITDENIRQEERVRKKSKPVKLVVATKQIYIDSIRTLNKRFNETEEHSVSLSQFFKYKPFYVLKPTEKEKQSCLCIYCLNPHVILKAINTFRGKCKLPPHNSLTDYLNELDANTDFEEINATHECKYYEYKRIKEKYYGKDGKEVEYTRTARVDLTAPVCQLVEKLRCNGKVYLKHRSYIDNCSNVLPLLQEAYSGKYVELDFSQNLSLRPKDEVQSAHFSGKQFTLHCAIVEPVKYRYHYHISDDTKHDPFFVDYVIWDIIQKYDIQNEDLWIQSDNAPTQYKNCHAFTLYQNLADEFNLRIIRTYGAAGHGKGAIDAMSTFGAKNILRNDIITKDVFFNDSYRIVNYLATKKPEYSYTEVSALEVVQRRPPNVPHTPTVIEQCMKQHMMIFEKNKDIILKEYLCDCSSCILFDFAGSCKNTEAVDEDEDFNFAEDVDSNDDIEEQVFDFVEVPSYATVLTRTNTEHLVFSNLSTRELLKVS